MKRVDEYGTTAMQEAEEALTFFEYGLDHPPLSVSDYNRRLASLSRAMLAAMREHNEMMRAKK